MVLVNVGIMEIGMYIFLSFDFVLFEFDENLCGVYDVYFNGWDVIGE